MYFADLKTSKHFSQSDARYRTHACVEYKASKAFILELQGVQVCRITHALGDSGIMIWRNGAMPVRMPKDDLFFLKVFERRTLGVI